MLSCYHGFLRKNLTKAKYIHRILLKSNANSDCDYLLKLSSSKRKRRSAVSITPNTWRQSAQYLEPKRLKKKSIDG